MHLSVVLLFVLITTTSTAAGSDSGSFPRQLDDAEPGELQQPQPRLGSSLHMNKPVKLLDAILQSLPLPQPDLGDLADLLTSEINGSTEAPPATGGSTTAAPDPDAVACSGRPFDGFTQLSNGSIHAFRGDYVFELGQGSVLPGYPKLIKDVWGMTGPIDAAFTRFNCQGKTYIFKGNKYWRFDKHGVLDEDYPRDISVGFDKILYPFDAAFSLPPGGHHVKEKFFLFKAEQYATYEFIHRPTPDQCHSALDDDSEDLLSDPISDLPQHHSKHHFIEKDWRGLKSPVDAALTGKIFAAPVSSGSDQQDQDFEPRRRGFRTGQVSDIDQERIENVEQDNGIQAAYFFRGAKYYRVDISSKRVEPATPPYPRSIAKYWLGCKDED